MFSKKLIIRNKVAIAIVLFLAMFAAFHMVKPGFAYEDDGSFRTFGVGYKHKTVVPVWIVAILMAIFAYLAVLYYIHQC